MAIDIAEMNKEFGLTNTSREQLARAQGAKPTTKVPEAVAQSASFYANEGANVVRALQAEGALAADIARAQEDLKERSLDISVIHNAAVEESYLNYDQKTSQAQHLRQQATQAYTEQLKEYDRLNKTDTSGIFAPFKIIARDVKMSLLADNIRGSEAVINRARAIERSALNDMNMDLQRVQSTTIAQMDVTSKAKLFADTKGAAEMDANLKTIRDVGEQNMKTGEAMVRRAQDLFSWQLTNEQAAAARAAREKERLMENNSGIKALAWVLRNGQGTMEEAAQDKKAMTDALVRFKGMTQQDASDMVVLGRQLNDLQVAGKGPANVDAYLTYARQRVSPTLASQLYGSAGQQESSQLLDISQQKYMLGKMQAATEAVQREKGALVTDAELKTARKNAAEQAMAEMSAMPAEQLLQKAAEGYATSVAPVSRDGREISHANVVGGLPSVLRQLGYAETSPEAQRISAVIASPEAMHLLDAPVLDSTRGVFHKLDALDKTLEMAGIPAGQRPSLMSRMYTQAVRSQLARSDEFARALAANGLMDQIPVRMQVDPAQTLRRGKGIYPALAGGSDVDAAAQAQFLETNKTVDLSDPAAMYRLLQLGRKEQSIPTDEAMFHLLNAPGALIRSKF